MSLLAGVFVVMALAAVSITGCGNGDDSTAKPGDAGTGTDGQKSDAGDSSVASDGSDAGAPAAEGGDASDATVACNFGTFVRGLIANDTTMTALPSTDLGQMCLDDQNQADFQSLFP
jgi:hypothetical protein